MSVIFFQQIYSFIKINDIGDILWEKPLRVFIDYFEIIQDNNILARSSGYAYKYDENANKIWGRGFSSDGGDWGKIHHTIDNGCIYIDSKRDSSHNYGIYLGKTDENGKISWDTRLNLLDDHSVHGRDVCQTNDQGFLAVGGSWEQHAIQTGGYLYLFKLGSGSTLPDLDIKIENGKGVNAYLKNTGDTVISDIDWSLDVEDGFILFKTNPSGIIDEIEPGETIALDRLILFGFGLIIIKITLNEMISSVGGLLFGTYVFI